LKAKFNICSLQKYFVVLFFRQYKRKLRVRLNFVLTEMSREFETTPTWAAIITVLGYAVLSVFGWLREFLRHIGLEKKRTSQDPNPKVYF